MTLDDFLVLVKSANPLELAEESLHRNFVHAIPEEATYSSYLDQVRGDYPLADCIAIMGSGNWKFSLNPKNNFSEYHIKSDIDIAVVCRTSFEQTWAELRIYHRTKFYSLSHEKRSQLKRSGENVYAGFVSPKWIPDKQSGTRYKYMINTNKYSNADVGFRVVNLMYFKNIEETLDYYVRGFLHAQQR